MSTTHEKTSTLKYLGQWWDELASHDVTSISVAVIVSLLVTLAMKKTDLCGPEVGKYD